MPVGSMPALKLFKEVEDRQMSTRRKIYWWFWFVASGRFLATFLDVQS
jgi:hypothetical protein